MRLRDRVLMTERLEAGGSQGCMELSPTVVSNGYITGGLGLPAKSVLVGHFWLERVQGAIVPSSTASRLGPPVCMSIPA